MSGIVEVAKCALALDEPVTPDPMGEVLQILHGEFCCDKMATPLQTDTITHTNTRTLSLPHPPDILLTILEDTPNLQNKASEALEAWWAGDGPDREGVVPNCLLYIIARSLSDKAKVRVQYWLEREGRTADCRTVVIIILWEQEI